MRDIKLMDIKGTTMAIGAIFSTFLVLGGGWLSLDMRHEPKGAVAEVKTELKQEMTGLSSKLTANDILTLVDQAQRDGAAPWLCRAIEEAFIELCTDSPEHYLCRDPEAKRELKAKAGCS